MEYKLTVPTFELSALTKISATLWKGDLHIAQALCDNHFSAKYDFEYKLWPKIESIVNSKLDELVLPPIMKDSLRAVVKFMGKEQLEFLTSECFCSVIRPVIAIKLVRCIQHVRWTPHGKIDESETVRALSKHEELFTRNERFKLACVFCIEDEVKRFWRKSVDDFVYNYDSHFPRDSIILPFWAEVMNEMDGYVPMSRNVKFAMLRFSLQLDNVSAVKYLFSILTVEEKIDFMDYSWNYLFMQFGGRIRRTVYFLLSEMHKGQFNLEEFLLKFGAVILKHLIGDWVYVDLFLARAEHYCAKLNVQLFKSLIVLAARQLLEYPDDTRFQKCVKELWTNASPESREYFVQSEFYNFLVG